MSINTILFAPVATSGESPPRPTQIGLPATAAGAIDLFLDDHLLLGVDPGAKPSGGERIASLAFRREGSESAWHLIPRARKLAVNGLEPLPLMRLEPGALLSAGDRFWMVCAVWQPQPVEAPAELRDKSCPVCGGELHLAPVVQCVCGRWLHLERPDVPDDKDALNCYLVSDACGNCGRPASLSPQILPEIPERLLPMPDEDDWFPSEFDEAEAAR